MPIELVKNESNNTSTILIKGAFNCDLSSEFRHILESVTEPGCNVVIDMSMVDEIDSSALGMLLLLREQYGGNPNDIKIIKCRQDIHDVLRMANFQTMFNIDEL